MTTPPPPPPPDAHVPAPGPEAAAVPLPPAGPLGDAAGTVRRPATQAHGALERTAAGAELLDRIPGRSVTLAGLGLVGTALLVSLLPSYSGIGFAWSTLMLAGGSVVAVNELRAAGVRTIKLPRPLRHPLVAPSYAALVALHAFQLLTLAPLPLLWLGAALLLGWDQSRTTVLNPEGFGRHFDLRQAWRGYRRNVAAGVALCLVSLFFTWGQSSGYWSGGYSYNYTYGGGYEYTYNTMQYYWPGWEVSGRNQDFALFATAALLGLLLLSALRRDGQEPAEAVRWTAVGLGAFLAVFWLQASKDGMGALLFLVGLGMIGFAVFQLARGHDRGRWDLAHLTDAVRQKAGGRQG